MKLCYVVTAGNECDRYLWMACVSILAAKRLHSNAQIVVLCDESSLTAIQGGQARLLLDLADEFQSVPCPFQSARERNRFVKTSMRSHVVGDFLYLDADTVPVRPLTHVFQAVRHVGGVPEFNKRPEEHFFPEAWNELYDRLGWKYPTSNYINGGVLMLRDTPQTHLFAEEWHRRWLKSNEAGVSSDQPSLNSALYESGIDLTLLPNEYNAMVLLEPWRFRGCHLAHFFESNEVGGSLLGHLVHHLMETGELDEAAIDRSKAEGHPWAPGYEPWQLWRSRNYVRAILAKGRRVFRI